MHVPIKCGRNHQYHFLCKILNPRMIRIRLFECCSWQGINQDEFAELLEMVEREGT